MTGIHYTRVANCVSHAGQCSACVVPLKSATVADCICKRTPSRLWLEAEAMACEDRQIASTQRDGCVLSTNFAEEEEI